MKLFMLFVFSAACFAQQVRFPVVVLDRDERFIKNLNASHFRLSENGVDQTVQSAEISSGGISLGVVADKSNSLSGSGPAAQNFLAQGLVSALDQSAPDDDFFVIVVSTEAYLACDFTRDSKMVVGAFQNEKFRGGTALWDGMFLGVNHLERAKNPKRGILVVSDGEDNNSRRSRTDVEELLKRSLTPIFVFNPDSSGRVSIGPGGPQTIERISLNSGGWYKQSTKEQNAGAYLLWIRDFFRAQYTLTYTPSKPGPAGKWRKVKVQVTPPDGRKGVSVVAPAGYYFPSSPGR